MLETAAAAATATMTTTKRVNVATVIANLEKRQRIDFAKMDFSKLNGRKSRKENKLAGENGKEIIDSTGKESETDSEREPSRCEENKKGSFNAIREEKETEVSVRKEATEGDDSSPEESTLKQTWSESLSTGGAFTSGSDFSSSDYEEEYIDGKDGDDDDDGIDKEKKRNSITKDVNSDFHWIISAPDKHLFDKKAGNDVITKKRDSEPKNFAAKRNGENDSAVSFYPADMRSRHPSDHPIYESADSCVRFRRLPPQRPGSLDRKRLTKCRPERDQKCKSSVMSGSPQAARKCQARSLGEGMAEADGKRYFFPTDEWQGGGCTSGDDGDKCCQRYANIFSNHGYCSGYCGYRHCHHATAPSMPSFLPPRCSSPHCSSGFGSCENIRDKLCRKNSFGSQRSLEEQKKFFWSETQQQQQQERLRGSNECLPVRCCSRRDTRDKFYSWKLFGKSGPELEERLIRLENDKESLQLQVSVLTEQVEAQSEKISDLQQTLNDKKQQLSATEDMLQREILTRSSLETQKLELMSAISELKLQQAAAERENYELKEEKRRYREGIKPPIMPRNASPGLLQSSPSDYPNARKSSGTLSGQDHLHGDSQPNSFSESHHKYLMSSTPNNKSASASSPLADHHRQLSMQHHQQEDVRGYFSSSPQPHLRKSMDHYSSLPRQKILEAQDLTHFSESRVSSSSPSARVSASGKGLTSLITLKSEKSYSAPNLAETEKQSGDQPDGNQRDGITTKPADSSGSQQGTTNRKGIKKLFIKIKRSNSGNVNDLVGDGNFKREKMRATMLPRIGSRICQVFKPPDKPFAEWDTDSLCGWLEELCLENYLTEFRRWVKNGNQLLSASPSEIEKELGMKNQMHKKKLLLALQEMSQRGMECDELLKPAGCLDTAWVMRWLDDVGLPQHKEVFLTARVDGRMLHRLTMDDLATMHITSALHVASLKRGIKVLREYKMDPNCLTRRSMPNEPPPTASDVALWTNHRVMEWLRVVDLAEYAPNLRGSGVHGALLVYETKFTADLLATLLNIPPNKTLLRRHLNTHFKELLGRAVIQGKREAETTLGYIPLTPSAKVKISKKPPFTLKRKKNKQDFDFGDLVCPLEDGASGENSLPTNASCMSANGGGSSGGMKERRHVPDVCPLTDPSPRESPLATRVMRI